MAFRRSVLLASAYHILIIISPIVIIRGNFRLEPSFRLTLLRSAFNSCASLRLTTPLIMAYMNRAYLHRQCSPCSYSRLKVDMPAGNYLDLRPGDYRLLIGGWKCPCDPACIRDHKVGLIVKCSGTIPGGLLQMPEDTDYARQDDQFLGRQPYVVQFPIMHAHYKSYLRNVLEGIKYAWENGESVFFHCNNGSLRSPGAACVVLAVVTRTPAVGWLGCLTELRDISPTYADILDGRMDSPHSWKDYILYCRLHDYPAVIGEWKWTTSLHDYPAVIVDGVHALQSRLDEEAAMPTPIEALTPNTLDAHTNRADGVVNLERDPAPIWYPPGPPSQTPPTSLHTGSRNPLWEPVDNRGQLWADSAPTAPPLQPAARAAPPLPKAGQAGHLVNFPLVAHISTTPPAAPPTIPLGLATAMNEGNCVSDDQQAKQLPQSGPPVAEASPTAKKSPKSWAGLLLPKRPPPNPERSAKLAAGALMPKATTQTPAPNFGNTGSAPIAAPAALIDVASGQQVDNLTGQNLLAAAVPTPHFGESSSASTVALRGNNKGDFIDEKDESYSLMDPGIYNQGLPQTRLPTLPKAEGAPPVTDLSSLLKPVCTGIAESTAASEIVSIHGPIIDEEDEHVSDRVKRVVWKANPNKRQEITTSALSGSMRSFLFYNHNTSTEAEKSEWRYNEKGFHPFHTLMESLCAKSATFPKDHPSFHTWYQGRKNDFVLHLVREAVEHTLEEYGDCTCRTQSDRPTDNTPLMFLAKAECKVVDHRTLIEILQMLVIRGGGINAVDSNGSNALMLAAGHDNQPIFKWFYDNAWYLRDTCGFEWNHKNNDRRNVLALVKKRDDNGAILNWCMDLAMRGFIEGGVVAYDTQRRGGRGGSSGVNQRYRSTRYRY